MTVPPPPVPFPLFNTGVIPAGTSLVRVHAPDYAGDSFNPCKGEPSRFAPLADLAGACLPTLYAGEGLECAVHESIFHHLVHDAPDKFIPLTKVTSRAVSWLETTQDLIVARLNEPDLNRLGLTRAQLIDTPASTYGETARWAEAFHRTSPPVMGLGWTSRRCDPAQAYVLFEDRTPPGALAVVATLEVATSAQLLDQIRQFGRRAGITITV